MSGEDELWKTFDRDAKKLSGVYVLRVYDTVLYVGQSNDILNRVKSHRHIPWKHCSYLVIDNQEEKARMEESLIKENNPIYNILKKKTLLPNQMNSAQHSFYTGKNREERWRAEAEIIKKYRDQVGSISSRWMQRLLWHEYGVVINHNSINKDLREKKYTPYL